MANKFDVPPVQSTGILMQGLGQGLVEFGNVYGATKLATIEAEAQRNKEMRIMQMENIRNNMNDAFRYASYENDQERLQLARNADARAELSEGRAERSLILQEEKAKQDAKVKYTFEKVPVYGWVELTEEEKSEIGADTSTSKKVWKQTGTQLWAVNPYDPNDRFQVDKPVSEQQVDTLFNVDSPNEFSSRSEAENFIKDQIRATGGNPDNLSQSYMDKILADLISRKEITISANGSSSNQSEAEYGSADNYGYGEYELPPEPPAVVSEVNPTSQSVMAYMARDYYSGDQAFNEDASEGLLSRKDDLPIMEIPTEEILNPEDAMFIPTTVPDASPKDGLFMQNNESANVPDLGTGPRGEMPLDQPNNVSGPRLPTGDKEYVPPDNADMQYPQARKQAIDLVESMKNVNLPEDVIRSELLRLIQEIPQEQANSAYAQALVDVFNELFSGIN